MANAEIINRLKQDIASIESGSCFTGITKCEPSLAACDCPVEEKGKAGSSSAFSKIVNLVNVSDRSERAIRERLVREGFDEDDIEDSIKKAKEYAFIDDARFAEVLVRSRISQGRGCDGIERELKSHGIDIYSVNGWPHDYPVSYEDEVERALGLLERKPPRSKNLRDSAYRKLVGRGFSPSVASTSARLWSEKLQS